MPKAKKPKSIREAMTEVGRAADTKLDAISKSVKQNEKDIADIKKMVKDMQKVLAKVVGPAKKTGTAKKSTTARKTTARKRRAPKKRAASKKQGKPAKKREKLSEPSLFPF